MTVLVTGGTGFTGSALVRRLLDQGEDVRALDNQPGLFFDELKERGTDIRLGSVADAEAVDEAVDGCEVVHHLAAAFRQLDVSDAYYTTVNVEGTRNVARSCLKHGVRKLVYCSTQGVHGHIKQPPGDEQSPIAPEDFYQYSKYEGERALGEFIDQGLDAVTLRPTAIYGPGDPERFLMLFRMVKKGRFLMFGSGRTFYHPVHIDNLVDAFLLAAQSGPETTGQAFLIADEKYWSLKDLVLHVARAMNTHVKILRLPFWPLYGAACVCEAVCKPLRIAPPIFRRRVNWYRQDRAFRIEKAQRQLGYTPRVGIEEGLAGTANWYRQHGYI